MLATGAERQVEGLNGAFLGLPVDEFNGLGDRAEAGAAPWSDDLGAVGLARTVEVSEATDGISTLTEAGTGVPRPRTRPRPRSKPDAGCMSVVFPTTIGRGLGRAVMTGIGHLQSARRRYKDV